MVWSDGVEIGSIYHLQNSTANSMERQSCLLCIVATYLEYVTSVVVQTMYSAV